MTHSQIQLGGDAFPIGDGDCFYPGMSLLDYFADQALVGLVDSRMPRLSDSAEKESAAETLATTAFVTAEAMVAESRHRQLVPDTEEETTSHFLPDLPPVQT